MDGAFNTRRGHRSLLHCYASSLFAQTRESSGVPRSWPREGQDLDLAPPNITTNGQQALYIDNV